MPDLLTALLGQDDSVFQDRRQRKAELARDMAAASYLTGDFVLSDGRTSSYYFEPVLFMTKPTVLRRLVNVLSALVPQGVDRIAGTEPGSMPVATGLSLETGIPLVSLRERRQSGSLRFEAAGEVHAGERVVLIEDVATTGDRAIAAANALSSIGVVVESVLCLVDREEGARAHVTEAGYRFEPLFTVSDLVAGSNVTAKGGLA